MFRLVVFIVLIGTKKQLHIVSNNHVVNKKKTLQISGIYSKHILLHCCIVDNKINPNISKN